jgi:hypothetical protein
VLSVAMACIPSVVKCSVCLCHVQVTGRLLCTLPASVIRAVLLGSGGKLCDRLLQACGQCGRVAGALGALGQLLCMLHCLLPIFQDRVEAAMACQLQLETGDASAQGPEVGSYRSWVLCVVACRCCSAELGVATVDSLRALFLLLAAPAEAGTGGQELFDKLLVAGQAAAGRAQRDEAYFQWVWTTCGETLRLQKRQPPCAIMALDVPAGVPALKTAGSVSRKRARHC